MSAPVRSREPRTELDARYGSDGAQPASWSEASRALAAAEIYWVTTIRRDGRPHVTPLIAVWVDGALYFSTGPEEQKAKNLQTNSRCILTTGCNSYASGLDLVVEGDAVNERDDTKLQRIADAFEAKYGREWHFDVADGAFRHDPGVAVVYKVEPSVAYAFGRGEQFSHTRFRFELR
jgi:general stress protein 26